MDKHLSAMGSTFRRGRLLETAWYVAGPTNSIALRDYVRQILSPNDLLLVVEAKNATWTKLLVNENEFKTTFEAQEKLAA
jgi:hypothetical protein